MSEMPGMPGMSSAGSGEEQPSASSMESAAGAVRIDPARRQEFGIRTAPVQIRDLSTTVRAVGRALARRRARRRRGEHRRNGEGEGRGTLSARRSELDLTLMTVATDAGLSVPYVANLEKGRGNPTLDVIVGLARALGVSPAELLGVEDEADGRVDDLFSDLPPVLIDYARGKLLRAATERIALRCGLPADEMRLLLLRAMAASPRPFSRPLSAHDVRRQGALLVRADPAPQRHVAILARH